MALTTVCRRYAVSIGAFMRRDLLRALRLTFLLALGGVACATLIGLTVLGSGVPAMAISSALLATIFGLRLLEYRRMQPVPVWVDVLELAGVWLMLAQHVEIEPIISTFFLTVVFRSAVGRLSRLLLLVAGYEAVWITASVVYPSSARAIPGAMISLVVISMLMFGTRHLLLRLQEQHRAQSALLDDVLSRLPFPVIVTDAGGAVLLANPAANDLVGWPAGSTPALDAVDVFDVEEQRVDLRSVARAAAGSEAGAPEFEVRLTRADGTTRQVKVQTVATDGFSQVSGVVLALLDVTAQRTHEQYLHQAAHFDMLTGLPNRRLLWERLTSVHEAAVPYAVLLIDLNEFKQVNDTFGHKVGDELLCGVAHRLQGALQESATVARLGGDEFAVLLPHASAAQAEAAAEVVRETFATPFELSCGPLAGKGAVGVAVAGPGGTPDDVIVAADAALYSAKPDGRRRVRSAQSPRQQGRHATANGPN